MLFRSKAFGEVVSAVRVRPHKPRVQQRPPVPPCTDCGEPIQAAMGRPADWLAAYTAKNYGVPLCAACAQKRKDAAAGHRPEEREVTGHGGEESPSGSDGGGLL